MTKNEAVFTKDLENKKLTVVRAFDAPLEQVWKAWTTAEMLDHWWAPKPFKAETKSMDFRNGGEWLYCMAGPEGERNWCRVDYHTVDALNNFTCTTGFCDEEGNENADFPKMTWKSNFSQDGNGTTVKVEITFDKPADMEMILQMGFQEGFTAALGNLDEYFSSL